MARWLWWEKPPYNESGCEWHSHSMFRRCANGLSLFDYLVTPGTEEQP